MKNTTIVGGKEPNKKKLFIVLAILVAVIVVGVSIAFVLKKDTNGKIDQTEKDGIVDVINTETTTETEVVEGNTTTTTPDEDGEKGATTTTPDGTDVIDKKDPDKDIIGNLPDDNTEVIPDSTNEEIKKIGVVESNIPDDVETYIDFSNQANVSNWNSIFEFLNAEKGDTKALEKYNIEVYKTFEKNTNINISEEYITRTIKDTLSDIRKSIKNQYTKSPDSYETEMLKRVIESKQPEYDVLSSNLFYNEYAKNMTEGEWSDIVKYWMFNNDFTYRGENQKTHSIVYAAILTNSYYAIENLEITPIVSSLTVKDYYIEGMKVEIGVSVIMNGRIRQALFSVINNKLVLLDIN